MSFQLNPDQSDAPVSAPDFAGGSYKDYIGLCYEKGFFCPAWIDISNSTGDNQDTPAKFEVYTIRTAY